MAARGLDGSFAHFGVLANDHRNHILDVTVAPAPVPPGVEREAVGIARGILEGLEVVGVLCVEMFLTRDGRLLVNELAPRPHNSGHLTFDACLTSQFEQQLRAICGLPLGSTELLRPAAMANLLGDLWNGGEPDWAAACRFPDVKLHLYGKAVARTGQEDGAFDRACSHSGGGAGAGYRSEESPHPQPLSRPHTRTPGRGGRARSTGITIRGLSRMQDQDLRVSPRMEMKLELALSPLPGVRVCGWERGRG